MIYFLSQHHGHSYFLLNNCLPVYLSLCIDWAEAPCPNHFIQSPARLVFMIYCVQILYFSWCSDGIGDISLPMAMDIWHFAFLISVVDVARLKVRWSTAATGIWAWYPLIGMYRHTFLWELHLNKKNIIRESRYLYQHYLCGLWNETLQGGNLAFHM